MEFVWPQIGNAFALPLDQFFGRYHQLNAVGNWWQGDSAEAALNKKALAELRRGVRAARRKR
jgi:hypothetical protein